MKFLCVRIYFEPNFEPKIFDPYTKFIDNYIDPNRIKQYFEQAPLKKTLNRDSSDYHQMLIKHNIKNSFIYDGQAPCGSELATLSLKQTLDYARRLITKLCFRAEEGGFGAPNNLLSGNGG